MVAKVDKNKVRVRPPPLPVGDLSKVKVGPKKDAFRIGGDPKKIP